MNIETLKLFCCTNSEKEALAEPYSSGDFTFATNGHVQIRVSRLPEVPESEIAPKIAITEHDAVGKHYLKEPTEWVALPAVTVEPKCCTCCGGTGKAFQCPECDGDGWIGTETPWHRYDDQECKSCKGTGQVSESRYALMSSWKAFMPDPVPENCDSCNHGIIWPMVGEVINGVRINVRFLNLIGRLPGAQLGLFGELEIARFRFDGGDGLVMPMKM